MWVIGLTGGIGSGKSTVADCFAKLGVPVIDTDAISRELTTPARGASPDTAEGTLRSSGEPTGVPPAGGLGAVPGGTALPAIRAAFGDAVMQADGTLDRAALRRCVFADSAARHQLETILHPRIRQIVGQRLAELAELATPYALLVIPLLVQRQDRPQGERLAAYPLRVETDAYRDVLNRVLVVDCPEATQIARVIARSGFTLDEVQAILAAQATRAERLAAADEVIANVGSAASLCAEVAELHQRYLALAAASP